MGQLSSLLDITLYVYPLQPREWPQVTASDRMSQEDFHVFRACSQKMLCICRAETKHRHSTERGWLETKESGPELERTNVKWRRRLQNKTTCGKWKGLNTHAVQEVYTLTRRELIWSETLKGKGWTWNEKGRTWTKKEKTWHMGGDIKTKGHLENER